MNIWNKEGGSPVIPSIKVALPFVHSIVCHFGATYMDGMTGDLPFLFKIFKGDLSIKTYARFDGILTEGYILNGLSILDVKFANIVPLWSHLWGRDHWWPPFFIWDFQRGSDLFSCIVFISLTSIFLTLPRIKQSKLLPLSCKNTTWHGKTSACFYPTRFCPPDSHEWPSGMSSQHNWLLTYLAAGVFCLFVCLFRWCTLNVLNFTFKWLIQTCVSDINVSRRVNGIWGICKRQKEWNLVLFAIWPKLLKASENLLADNMTRVYI